MIDVMSFEDLEIKSTVDIIEACERHSAQAGSVFGRRTKAVEALSKAEDYVKYIRGKIATDCRIVGEIPGVTKMTDKALGDYVDQHPDMKQARDERTKAEMNLDNAKALVTAYLSNRDMLALIRSERQNSFHSSVESSRVGDPGYNL